MGEQLSLNEWVCLALLVERPRHGFAVAKLLSADSDLGRILTVRRPLVYRAIDRLVAAGLVEPHQTEPGESGPTRTVQRVTNAGRSAVADWLGTPVAHVRDLRVEFLVKLRLLERRGLPSKKLIGRQQRALGATLDGLVNRQADAGDDDVVDAWRAHNASAVSEFLRELQNRS